MNHPRYWLLTMIFMIFVTTSLAQKRSLVDAEIEKYFDEVLAAINKVDMAKPPEIKAAADLHATDDVFNQGLNYLNAETDRMKMEIDRLKKEYIPQPSGNNAGLDRAFLKLIADMPAPIINLAQAKQAMKVNDAKDIFSLYIEKVKRYQEQLKEEIQRNAPTFTTMPTAYKTKQELQNNQLIQEMGGLEKLQNMSQAEREALAKKMAEKMKQNPSAYNRQESDPRKAFTQKMLKEPTYAAKFNHMTLPQQQEEYELFKKENGFIDNEPQHTTGNAALNITIDRKVTGIFKHRQEMSITLQPLQENTDNYFAGVYKKLDEQLAQRVAALPVVDHGEAGKGKDTRPVDIAYSIVLLPIKAQEALSNKNIWASQLAALKVTIAEYDEFLGAYWGKNNSTDQLMIQRNQTPPAIIAGVCNDVIRLTQLAKCFTNMSASAQRAYDERVLSFYE